MRNITAPPLTLRDRDLMTEQLPAVAHLGALIAPPNTFDAAGVAGPGASAGWTSAIPCD